MPKALSSRVIGNMPAGGGDDSRSRLATICLPRSSAAATACGLIFGPTVSGIDCIILLAVSSHACNNCVVPL